VADARLYAERFGSRRIIHRDELHSQPDAEVILDGEDPVELAPTSSPSPRRATRPATASCSSAGATCSPATTSPGTATAAG